MSCDCIKRITLLVDRLIELEGRVGMIEANLRVAAEALGFPPWDEEVHGGGFPAEEDEDLPEIIGEIGEEFPFPELDENFPPVEAELDEEN